MGTPIGRKALVKLFASVLKKEGEAYFLVTPVEKLGITVEDVPYVITQWEQQDDLLVFTTQTEEQIIVSAERSFLHRVNGACDTPVAVNAVLNDDGEIFIQAEILSLDGKKVFNAHRTGISEKAASIGLDVAEEILDKAGQDFVVSETKLAHTIHKT